MSAPPASAPPKSSRRRGFRRGPSRDVPTVGDRISTLALRAVAGLLGLLGVDRASALMGRLWRGIAPFDRRHARADAHLAAALPALSAAERDRILRGMWENLGRTAAETLLLPRLIADRSRFDLHLGPLTDRPGDYSAGVVFASLHMGNWEVASWGARLAGFRVAAVYRRLKNPLADAYLKSLRDPVYDAGLHPSEGASAMRLFRLAKEGAAVCQLADLRDTTGIALPFLGRPAYCTTFPAVLARRLGRPLVAGRVLRTTGARFRIDVAEIPVPVTDDVAADVAAATRHLHHRLETWIAEIPEQWMWANRKWRPRRGETVPGESGSQSDDDGDDGG